MKRLKNKMYGYIVMKETIQMETLEKTILNVVA